MSGIRTITSAIEVASDTIGAISGVGEAGPSALISAVGGASDCLEAKTYDLVVSQCGPKGYTCLMDRLFASFSQIFRPGAALVLVTPATQGALSLDHSVLQGFAPPARLQLADSNGHRVELDAQNQTILNGPGLLLELGSDTQLAVLNEPAASRAITITGLLTSTVNIQILQLTSSGAPLRMVYASVPLAAGSIATLGSPSAGILNGPLNVDTDGNGTTNAQYFASSTLGLYPPGFASGYYADGKLSVSWYAGAKDAGYFIYFDTDGPGAAPYLFGPTSEQGVSPIDVGQQTHLELTGLTCGAYYLALSRYDAEGVLSGYSPEIRVDIPCPVFLPLIRR
jgi:hypothetical protein